MKRSLAALCLAALALCACHWAPTQLVVTLAVAGDVTQGPAGQVTDVELAVTVPGATADASVATRRIALASGVDGGPDGGVHLPAQLFAVLPRGASDATRPVRIDATGFHGTTPVLAASALAGFVAGTTTYVTLTLSPDCVASSCPVGSTCDASGCHGTMRDGGPPPVDAAFDAQPDVASDVQSEPYCGDGVCNNGETICTCRDCGDHASNGMCDCGETPDTSLDCPVVCGDHECSTARGEDPCCADCGDHTTNGHCDGSCENTCNDPAECGTNPIDGCCNGGETCANAPHDCDNAPCRCEVFCCGVPTGEISYQADACACRSRYLFCTGMTGSPRTYEIIYGPTMLYRRIPDSSGSYCSPSSMTAPNSC